MKKNEEKQRISTMMEREVGKLKEEIDVSQEIIKINQNKFANQIKNEIGPKMMEQIKPKSKIKHFFSKLLAIYG